MANSLFNQFGNHNNINNPLQQFLTQFNQLKKTYRGNPKEEVEKMLQSGQMSQQQFNQLREMANQIMQFVKQQKNRVHTVFNTKKIK